MSSSAHGPSSERLSRPADREVTAATDVPHAASAPEAPHRGSPILSFDEIVALHPGEWILLRVTAVEGGWPSQGEVLAHDASRTAITNAWADVVRSKRPDDRYYVFPACDSIRTGAELREALAVLRETWDGDLQQIWEDEIGRDRRRW